MNQVSLIGNITKDIEVRDTGAMKVCNFTLAVSEGKDKTSFINCSAFNGTAELLGKYTSKGTKIGVEGSLHQNSYTDKNGKLRNDISVYAVRVELLGSKPREEQKSVTVNSDYQSEFAKINFEEEIPF